MKLGIEREEVMVELVLLKARPPESSFNFSEVPGKLRKSETDGALIGCFTKTCF